MLSHIAGGWQIGSTYEWRRGPILEWGNLVLNGNTARGWEQALERERDERDPDSRAAELSSVYSDFGRDSVLKA